MYNIQVSNSIIDSCTDVLVGFLLAIDWTSVVNINHGIINKYFIPKIKQSEAIDWNRFSYANVINENNFSIYSI